MKKILLMLTISIIILCSLITCHAENFILEKSSVVDGDTNVAKDVTIELDFSANMVDISVANHNKNCFTVVDENGKNIPINLILPDTQVQDAYKKQAFIRPINELEMGKTYYLLISNNLVDKKGNKLLKDYQIKFTVTTDETLTTSPNQILEILKEDVTLYSIDNSTVPSIEETTIVANVVNESNEGKNNNYLFIVCIVVVIVLLFSVTTLLKKKDN